MSQHAARVALAVLAAIGLAALAWSWLWADIDRFENAVGWAIDISKAAVFVAGYSLLGYVVSVAL